MIPDRTPQHRIPRLERIQHRALRDRRPHVELNFIADVRQVPKMVGKRNADHDIVCTSTLSTAGRSRTIGFQLSPPSAEQYTCPPVVPK